MKLFVRSTGGLANFNIQGTVDTDELPDELADRVREYLTPENLAESAAPEPGAADMMQYEVAFLDEEGAESLQIDDGAPPEVLEVLDELLQEVVRNKREASE